MRGRVSGTVVHTITMTICKQLGLLLLQNSAWETIEGLVQVNASYLGGIINIWDKLSKASSKVDVLTSICLLRGRRLLAN